MLLINLVLEAGWHGATHQIFEELAAQPTSAYHQNGNLLQHFQVLWVGAGVRREEGCEGFGVPVSGDPSIE